MTTVVSLPPFLAGLAQGRVRYQACLDCGRAQTLQRFACQHCHRLRLEWRDAAGHGTVFACTTVTRAPSPAFRERVPYTLVLVDLDEGPRLMMHGDAASAIGDRVRVSPVAAPSAEHTVAGPWLRAVRLDAAGAS